MEFLEIFKQYSGLVALAIYLFALVIFLRYEANNVDDEEEEIQEVKHVENNNDCVPLDLNDEDATVASLIAAIECRNEFKKNVKVISVRKVN